MKPNQNNDVIDKSAIKRLRVQMADNKSALYLLSHIESLTDERNLFKHGHRIASDNCMRLEKALAHAQNENAELRATMGAASECKWPNCMAEKEQKDLADQIYRELYEPKEPLVFGMRGAKMFFSVGVQLFALDYEPNEPGEFEFMAAMLTKAIARVVPPSAAPKGEG